MKLTGPACTEAMSGDEEARRRERAEGRAGGVRVERRVRPNGIISLAAEKRGKADVGDNLTAHSDHSVSLFHQTAEILQLVI